MNFKYQFKVIANRFANYFGLKSVFPYNYVERLGQLRSVSSDLRVVYPRECERLGPRVVLFNPIGYTFQTLVTAVLAHALALRGARCTVFICDGIVPQCERRAITRDRGRATCRECRGVNETVYRALGVPYKRLSEYVPPETHETASRFLASKGLEDLLDASIHGMPVGGMAKAGALRYLFQSELDLREELQANVARQFLLAGATIAHACPEIFQALTPDRVVIVDGIYTYAGLYSHFARQSQIPTYVWNRGYKRNTITMSLGGNESEVLPKLSEEDWLGGGLDDSAARELDEYLESRKTNMNDFRVFIENPVLDSRVVSKALGLDRKRKVIGVFTNVAWDVAVIADDVPFKTMDEWLVTTVRTLCESDLQVVVRVHPYEADNWNRTRSGAEAALKRAFGRLPDNVRIIPPESKMSSYALIPDLDGAVVFSSKIGMELACFSIPVLTGGVAFYRNKGFTIDPKSQDEYHQQLGRVAAGISLTEAQVQRARCFAHYYFFRHYIPLHALDGPEETSLGITALKDLLPGCDADLDHLCQRILAGRACHLPVRKCSDYVQGDVNP